MKLNKTVTTEMIKRDYQDAIVPCKKLSMANIVMPALDKQGLMAYVFPGMVITKEQPKGCLYGTSSSPVIRILGGKLLKNGMADAYAWDAKTYK